MSKKIHILILSVLLVNLSFSQSTYRDSLEGQLNLHNSNDTNKVKLLVSLANEYYRIDIEKTLTYATQADSISTVLNYQKGKAESLRQLGRYFWRKSDYDKALNLFEEALEIFNSLRDKEGQSNCYNNIGSTYWRWGNYQSTLEYFEKSLALREELGDKEGMAASYNNIGIIYRTQGDYFNALDYYHKSVEIKEEINDKPGISDSYNNIAIIYSSQGDYDKALDYHNKSLELRKELGELRGMSSNYNNISIIYLNLGEYEMALDYVKKSIEIRERLDDKSGLASSFNNIGEIYLNLGDKNKSLEYYNKSIEISVATGLRSLEAYGYIGLAQTYLKYNQNQKAYRFGQKAFDLAQKIGDIRLLQQSTKVFSESSAAAGNYKDAYLQVLKFKAFSDSILNEENTRKIVGLEYEYKYQREKELARLEQEKIEAVHKSELKRQKAIRNSLVIGIGMVLILFSVLLFNFNQKRRMNQLLAKQKKEIENKNIELTQLNEEFQSQNDHLEQANLEIRTQKNKIEESHFQITESLTYAKFIQGSVLPKSKNFSDYFSEHMILYLPCNIVSGDFYYLKSINKTVMVAAADCTGHGVPGALMSMLGITLLNEILRNAETISPSQILTYLREEIKSSLHQSGEKGEQRDGMDIALCSIDFETLEMNFSGAYNPCWIFRRDKTDQSKYEHIILEADKTPVGIFEVEKPFREQKISLQKDDCIYLFSDGFHSQFGGEKKEKYQIKRLRSFLTKIQGESLPKQQELLENELTKWKGSNTQIDDILILGLKI